VYTDLAVIDVDAGALRVREMAEGISLPELERIVGLSLTAA
jgi:acyl CoA:acetate/3-ketoacid CoA transferase beta subunit